MALQSHSSIAQVLAGTEAFARLSSATRDRIAQLTGQRQLAAGDVLAREGDTGDCLFIVVSGSLLLTQQSPLSGETLELGSMGSGQVFGELGLLTGHPCPATALAAGPTSVLTLASADFDQLCAESPEEMAAAIAWMTARLDAWQIATAIEESPQLRGLSQAAKRELAAGFKRLDLLAGQILFRQGDPGDALYLVLSGRMRILTEVGNSEASRQHGDRGKGDLIGELALLTGEPRSATEFAVRDSHLARLDKATFDRIVAAYPSELLGLFTRQLAGRLRRQIAGTSHGATPEGRPPVAIAVLPLTASQQAGGAREFAAELVRQLSAFGPTLHLNRPVIDRAFRKGPSGRPTRHAQPVDAVAERRMATWLDDLEMLYRHVVYEADYQTGAAESAWTERCLRQADVLLVVAGGPADPKQSEQTMVRLSNKALPSVSTTLVLLHESGPGAIANTRAWKLSMGIANHEHVRQLSGRQIHSGDVSRIARALNRRSVGLVLGGGFALGLAHIGVVDAIRELDIPIDFVGGTSMGAILAAAAAQEFSHDQMVEVMHRGCVQALKGDYTLPILSLLTGKGVHRELGRYLERLDVEDLWLPWFAVSASLVHAKMVVHRSGSALKSVLASCRAPGMFPPLGWDGDLLVDGGLVNNVPADIMRDMVGEGTVIAADVSPETEFPAGHFPATHFIASEGMSGDRISQSGWQIARHNFSPLRRSQKMGTLPDVLMRLIRFGGVSHKQQIKASADLYMTIPLESFTVRDFHRGAELSQTGYQSALKQLTAWIERNGRPWLGGGSLR